MENDILTPEDVKELAPLYEDVILAIKQVYDPEIPVNIYDLGLIYDITVTDDFVIKVLMTLTAPNCPEADMLPIEIRSRLLAIEGVNNADVEITFNPPWDMDKMSEAAKLELNLF